MNKFSLSAIILVLVFSSLLNASAAGASPLEFTDTISGHVSTTSKTKLSGATLRLYKAIAEEGKDCAYRLVDTGISTTSSKSGAWSLKYSFDIHESDFLYYVVKIRVPNGYVALDTHIDPQRKGGGMAWSDGSDQISWQPPMLANSNSTNGFTFVAAASTGDNK